jgi:hypothetical protein
VLRVLDYTALLDAISETGNLTKSCKAVSVNKSNFLLHCSQDADLADRYARAREAGLDAEADRAIQEALEAEDAQLGRLALDARKWYLSKLLPQKYGDKVALTGGAPGDPAIKVDVDLSGLTDEQKRVIASLPLPGEGNLSGASYDRDGRFGG